MRKLALLGVAAATVLGPFGLVESGDGTGRLTLQLLRLAAR